MTLMINGHEFDDARTLNHNVAWVESRFTLSRSRFPRVSRDGTSSNALELVIGIHGEDYRDQLELLEGLCEQGQLLTIVSDGQYLWNKFTAIFATVLSLDFKEEAPCAWTANLAVEFKGSPSTNFAIFDVTSKKETNEYGIDGVTTIGLPRGTETVMASEVPPVIQRGNDFVVHNYGVLDSSGPLGQDTFRFRLSPELAHINSVQLLDGVKFVKGTLHEFQSDWTLKNGQWTLTSSVADNGFTLTYRDGTTTEIFSFGDLDPSDIGILWNDDEYVALILGQDVVVELWRGRDPIVTPGSKTMSYSNAAAPGADQFSVPANNALTITGTTIQISSNAFFKITTAKDIMPQESGDPNESTEVTPRFQIFIPDVDDTTTRKLEVLKRQA